MPEVAKIECEEFGATAVLRLDNGSKLNALTGAMLRGLMVHLDHLAADGQVRAVIVTGSGTRSFCAGADIKEWSEYEPFAFAGEWIALGHQTFDRLANFPKPVVAAINGLCFGGGLELAGACDVRVAVEAAQFALPEASIGINPGWSGVQRLRRSVPDAILRQMALTGARLSARRMYEVGFVNAVVADDPMPAALEIATRIAGLAPRATQITKAVLNASSGEASALLIDQMASVLLAKTEDKAEGIAAFKGKRKPEFKGK